MKRHDKNIRRERRMIQENGGKAEKRPLIGGELHVLSWANLEMSCKPLHRTNVRNTCLWNVVVLTECLQFRIEFANAVLVGLTRKFCNLFSKLSLFKSAITLRR